MRRSGRSAGAGGGSGGNVRGRRFESRGAEKRGRADQPGKNIKRGQMKVGRRRCMGGKISWRIEGEEGRGKVLSRQDR